MAVAVDDGVEDDARTGAWAKIEAGGITGAERVVTAVRRLALEVRFTLQTLTAISFAALVPEAKTVTPEIPQSRCVNGSSQAKFRATLECKQGMSARSPTWHVVVCTDCQGPPSPPESIEYSIKPFETLVGFCG